MTNSVKYSFPALFGASKNRSYREGIARSAKSLMKFLVKHELIFIEPFQDNGEVKENLIVRSSDLTPEGVEILGTPLQKWWKFLDNGGDAEDVTILDDALRKIHGANSDET